MSDDFDPYFKWLGIPPDQQPPDLYRLLGVPLFTEDPDVISHAVDRQMAHLRTFQSGPNAVHSQKLLNEISAARGCLLNAQRKAEYDRQLRQEIEVQQQPAEFFEADSQVFPPPSSQPPPLDPTTSSPEAAWPGTGSRSSTSRTYRKKPKKKKNSQLSLILILLFAALILGIALLNLLPEPQGAQPPAPVITPITNQEVAVGETLELAVIARSRAGTSTRLSYHL
ncbi:MAG: hypothetical protein GTO03_08985, partial [Planctomycetales bacterium]|nr:hypothetical protein [Planctomycetales bacterium]